VGKRQLGPGFLQQARVQCAACNGNGTSLRAEDRCATCSGQQVLKEKKVFEVHVERGMKRGDHVTFRGDGDQLPGVKLSGDIIIVFDEKPHPRLARRGDDLFMEHTLSLGEALTGFTLSVVCLDGRVLAVRSPPNACVDPAKPWCVEREGMPVAGTGGSVRGQLVIKFAVQFPQTLGDSDAAVLRKLLGVPPQPHVADDAEEVFLAPATVSQQRQDDDGADEAAARGGGGPRAATCAQQ